MFLRQASNIREGLLVINWEALGAIGEFIGALGVVISLVYLATQIRTQNNETKLAAVHEILVGFRDSLHAFGSGDLAEIFAKANEDYDALTNAESLKLLSVIVPMIRLWEEAFIQNEKGRLEDRVWDGINSQCSAYFNYAAFSRIWEVRGNHFDSKFQTHANSAAKSESGLP
jgi:hypothetical protein